MCDRPSLYFTASGATTGLCSTDEYQCANNQCVSEQSVCNTVDECGDFSDEIGCCK